ncbi:MAG: NRDE family protein [Gammaproteobacteria bacterium]|jgi:uncharacterized protein with NRDE domain
MCLILLAIDENAEFPFIVAANRDEFHARPTAPAHFWRDHPQVLAGRDLKEGGTWMGITKGGRFAAVTNFREESPTDAPRSRGELTRQFLLGATEPKPYLETIAQHGDQYRGFNLIVGSPLQGYFYYSNRTEEFRALEAGIYGISNGALDTPWPKVVHGMRALASHARAPTVVNLVEHLASREIPGEDVEGTGPERRASSTFIEGDVYGTRSSTVLIQTRERVVEFAEQLYAAGGEKGALNRFRFELVSGLANASSL